MPLLPDDVLTNQPRRVRSGCQDRQRMRQRQKAASWRLLAVRLAPNLLDAWRQQVRVGCIRQVGGAWRCTVVDEMLEARRACQAHEASPHLQSRCSTRSSHRSWTEPRSCCAQGSPAACCHRPSSACRGGAWLHRSSSRQAGACRWCRPTSSAPERHTGVQEQQSAGTCAVAGHAQQPRRGSISGTTPPPPSPRSHPMHGSPGAPAGPWPPQQTCCSWCQTACQSSRACWTAGLQESPGSCCGCGCCSGAAAAAPQGVEAAAGLQAGASTSQWHRVRPAHCMHSGHRGAHAAPPPPPLRPRTAHGPPHATALATPPTQRTCVAMPVVLHHPRPGRVHVVHCCCLRREHGGVRAHCTVVPVHAHGAIGPCGAVACEPLLRQRHLLGHGSVGVDRLCHGVHPRPAALVNGRARVHAVVVTRHAARAPAPAEGAAASSKCRGWVGWRKTP